MRTGQFVIHNQVIEGAAALELKVRFFHSSFDHFRTIGGACGESLSERIETWWKNKDACMRYTAGSNLFGTLGVDIEDNAVALGLG